MGCAAMALRGVANSLVGRGTGRDNRVFRFMRLERVMADANASQSIAPEASAGSRRARGGAEARRAARSRPKIEQLPFIARKIPLVEVLSEEGLQIIERNADT